jgi:hypothetical protein
VWIDYGVGHLPGVNADIIRAFLPHIRPDDLAIPGCWSLDRTVLTEAFPCWRFCGGLFVVARSRAGALDAAVRRAAIEHLDQENNVWWEVNSLALAEQRGLLPSYRWYQADHDQTMFTGYSAS